MKKVKTYLTKNQYQKAFFDLYGYDTPFNTEEEEEAEIKQIEHDRRQFRYELILRAQKEQSMPLNEEQIQNCLKYADEWEEQQWNLTSKAIRMKLDVIRSIEGN